MALMVGELAAVLKLKDDGFDQSMAKHQRGFTSFASTAGAAIAGIGFGAFAMNAKNQASDLNETMGKSEIIFGQNNAAMVAWASTAAETMGLSKQAALEAGAGFGDMFSQLGMGKDEAAGLSRQIVQMSADFGAFNNLGTEDVSQRIAAAFRGEYDSLQMVIPNINAARVEKEALAATGRRSASALTAEEKALAVVNILRTDGSRAMGNYAATADQVAQKEKTAAANAKNASAEFGERLIPLWDKATSAGNKLLAMFTALPDSIQTTIIAVGAVSAAALLLGPRLQAGRVALQGMGNAGIIAEKGMKNAAIAATALTIAVAAGSAFKGDTSLNASQLALSLEEFAKSGKLAGEAAEFLGTDFEAFKNNVRDLIAPDLWTSVDKALATPFASFGNAYTDMQGKFGQLDQSLAAMAATAPGQAAAIFSQLQQQASSAGLPVEEMSRVLFPEYTAAVATANNATNASAATDTAATIAKRGFATSIDTVNAALSRNAAKDDATRALKALSQSVRENGTTFRGNSDAALANRAALMQVVQAKMQVAKTKVANPNDTAAVEAEYRKMSGGMVRQIMAATGATKAEAKKIVREYIIAAKEGNQKLEAQKGESQSAGAGVGAAFTSGFGAGIGAGIPGVEAKAREVAQRAKDAAKAELDSHSPSRVMQKEGHNYTEGFALGITQRSARAVGAVRGLFGNVAAASEGWAGAALRATVATSPGQAGLIAVALEKRAKADQRQVEALNKRGLSKAAKKAGKSTGAGDLWKAQVDAERAWYDNQLAEQARTQSEAAQAAAQAAEQARQERESKVKQFAEGVQGDITQMKSVGSARTWVASQRKKLADYRNNMILLAKRGLPQEMLVQIANSQSAMAWAAALAAAPESDFQGITQDAMALAAESKSFGELAADVVAGKDIRGAALTGPVISPQYMLAGGSQQTPTINVVVQDPALRNFIKIEIDKSYGNLAGQLMYR